MYEKEVIEALLVEDEFVEQILEVCKRRFEKAIPADQLARELDAIHESATVSVEQRYGRETLSLDSGDSIRKEALEEKWGA